MGELTFRYGTVDSGKTLQLLATASSCRSRGEKVVIVAPAYETAYECEADIVIPERSLLDLQQLIGAKRVLVNACHLLPVPVVEQLRRVVDEFLIPVICYGLRTDFRSRLFPGSQRLLELADCIEQLEATCAFCPSNAIMNLKVARAAATLSGPQVELETGTSLLPCCSFCYFKRVQVEIEGTCGFAGCTESKQQTFEDDVFAIPQALHESFDPTDEEIIRLLRKSLH